MDTLLAGDGAGEHASTRIPPGTLHTLSHTLCFFNIRRGTDTRTDTKENIKAIMRKVDLFASDGPKRVITRTDIICAIVQGAGVTHCQRKKDYMDALMAFGFIAQANKTAFYFLEDAWHAHPLFAEMKEDIVEEIEVKEAVR